MHVEANLEEELNGRLVFEVWHLLFEKKCHCLTTSALNQRFRYSTYIEPKHVVALRCVPENTEFTDGIWAWTYMWLLKVTLPFPAIFCTAATTAAYRSRFLVLGCEILTCQKLHRLIS